MGAAPDASSLRILDDVSVLSGVEVAAARSPFHRHKEERMSQAEAVLRQEVQLPLNRTSSSRRRVMRPIRMVADGLRRQLELSRQRDALGGTWETASLGRDTGCRC